MAGEPGKRGRPRVWSSDAEKHQAQRARKAEKAALVEDLLHAVRNAALEDVALQQVVNQGDDADVLRALTGHYRARHWNLRWLAANQSQHGGHT
jgi:hypothetical protein